MSDRVRFEVAPAASFAGTYDLVCMFDCLHDMGDPVGAARHAHSALEPDGTWLIVEPFANDNVEDNLNPVGRVYYGASTLVCTPASLSQEVGLGLGAQAGEARLREVVTAGGLHALPPRHRDAVQHRARGAGHEHYDRRDDVAAGHPCARTRPRRVRRAGRRTGFLRIVRRGRAHHPPPAELDDRAAAPVEGAGAVFRPSLPRRHVRPARQRRVGPARRSAAYADRAVADDALAVLDALGVEQAALRLAVRRCGPLAHAGG